MAEQESGFPGDQWVQISPREAGWNERALEQCLIEAGESLSTGVVMLEDGRIAVEHYWPLPDLGRYPPQLAATWKNMLYGQSAEGHPLEDVASVQKSVVATLAAIAVQKGLIAFDDPVARYLGDGWADVTPEQSAAITLRHVMTMTSGLTESLTYQAPPGREWWYNTAAYQNLLLVIASASGMDANTLTRHWLTGPLGMSNTRWVERDWAKQSPPMMGLVTTPRDLARFGLLILHRGQWQGEQIVAPALVDELTRQSQALNPSYGMLFWLNSAAGYRNPASEDFMEGKRLPAAPDDTIAALGVLNRFVFILPSQKIVIVRTGLADLTQSEEDSFARRWWRTLSRVFGLTS